MTVIWAQGRI